MKRLLACFFRPRRRTVRAQRAEPRLQSPGIWRAFFLLLLWCFPASAQLAKNFYYINKIESRVLPNAVQVVIRTDGVVQFGLDLEEVFELNDQQRYVPKPINKIRLRFTKARAKLPAFNEVGAYPVDGSYVSPGRDALDAPYFNGYPGANDPVTDVELRFYVPVQLRKLNPFGASGDIGGSDDDDRGYNFADVLSALDVGIELGRDRRSVVITVISDRVDALHTPSLHRAPPRPKTRLNIRASETAGEFRCDVLHTSLRRVLDAASRTMGLPLVARAEAADIDVTLFLPSVKPREFLEALVAGYALNLGERPAAEGGGYEVGRGGDLDITRRITLNHLAPERARLLFPDFLLPRLRVDAENNALLATGSPQLVERIARDAAKLDVAHPQVKVQATAWELSSGMNFDLLLRAAVNRGDKLGGSFDLGEGLIAAVIDPAQAKALTANLTALQTRSAARFVAKPYVLVASGERGSLFSGQNRFITVLRRRRNQQNAEALKLSIGYGLNVTPRVGGSASDSEILLELNPTISSVDEIEAGTGLPTLALREVNTTVRLRPGDSVIIAGLQLNSEAETRRGLFVAEPSRRDAHRNSSLVFWVTVERV